ncbi:MAG: hypothetical protein IAE91_13645, partial [Ignavibacteriaceae bacterium]|nr:hypothetical protein [Ignavibacteriaceae bacterium]
YIFTDFSPSNKGINIVEHEEFTDLYFCEFEAIKDKLSKYEPVKLIVVEKECDIFDVSKHIKIAVYIEDKHEAKIEFTDQDILFLE